MDAKQAPVWPFVPLVRSGELFTKHDEDFRTAYFDQVAAAPAGLVAPEHVFGVNGWRRQVEEAGADPKKAFDMFSAQWGQLPFSARRDLLVGNAVARFYAPGIAEAAANANLAASRDAGAVVSKDPDIGYLVLGDPVKTSEEYQRKLFGDYVSTAVDPLAELMDAGEEAQA